MNKYLLTILAIIGYCFMGFGSLEAREVYAPDATTRTSSAVENQLGFNSSYHDDESDLVYKRARYYSPNQGRFIGRDSLEYVDGMSLYGNYFGLNGNDPSGNSTQSDYYDSVNPEEDEEDECQTPPPVEPVPVSVCCVDAMETEYIEWMETKDIDFAGNPRLGKGIAQHKFKCTVTFGKKGKKTDGGRKICDPSLCVFTQEVKGYFKVNGDTIPRPSGAGLIVRENAYVDDGYTMLDDTDMDPLVYVMYDHPGMALGPLVGKLDVLQSFRQIVKDKNTGRIVAERRNWTRITGEYPRTFTHGGFDRN